MPLVLELLECSPVLGEHGASSSSGIWFCSVLVFRTPPLVGIPNGLTLGVAGIPGQLSSVSPSSSDHVMGLVGMGSLVWCSWIVRRPCDGLAWEVVQRSGPALSTLPTHGVVSHLTVD